MKKLHNIFLILLIFSQNFFSDTFAQSQEYVIKKIVIDAGHGGKDPGAIGKKSYEKDITLAIALKVGNYIKQNIPDVEVIYTRKTDVFIELHKRAEIANEAKADIFISIHVNSTKSSTPSGTSTYVMGLHKSEENLEVALKENSVILIEDNYKITYEGYDPNASESYIIMNLYQNLHLEQSVLLASMVQDQFRKRTGRKDLGVKQAGLVVLWNATMPSILIETGFISNQAEERYLITEEGQNLIASAIYRAFKEYKSAVEVKNNKSSAKNNKNTKTEQNITKTENKNKEITQKTESEKNSTKSNNNQNTKSIQKKDKEIIFTVQIKSSPKAISLKANEFKGEKNITERKIDKEYKYTIGETANYKEILNIQTNVRKKFPDAFVIAFKDGKKISVNKALEEQKKK